MVQILTVIEIYVNSNIFIKIKNRNLFDDHIVWEECIISEVSEIYFLFFFFFKMKKKDG